MPRLAVEILAPDDAVGLPGIPTVDADNHTAGLLKVTIFFKNPHKDLDLFGTPQPARAALRDFTDVDKIISVAVA